MSCYFGQKEKGKLKKSKIKGGYDREENMGKTVAEVQFQDSSPGLQTRPT